MELNLGSRAVFQLQETFQFLNSQFDCEGFFPVVNISVEIARELYQLYIESVNLQKKNQNQLLAMLNRQDEIYAKQLIREDLTSEFVFLTLRDQEVKLQQNERNRSKDFVELILDSRAISQLEAQFGDYGRIPQGYQPVIQVSLKLAEQLHSAYIQSVRLQKQNEDQLLSMMAKQGRKEAKKLRQQENRKGEVTTNAKEVEKKETNPTNAIESTFQRDKTNLLFVQKLSSTFSSVSKELAMELLMAFEYSYEEVFDVLKASSVKVTSETKQKSTMDTGVNEARSVNTKKTAEKCREEAQMYLEKQLELNSKAKQAAQQKKFYVAQHYSETARTYRHLHEEANEMAVRLLMEEENMKHSDTLDLHHFNVKEAIQSLNMYLDAKINLLKKLKRRMKRLSIITGIGRHSGHKGSKLGPAVQELLRKRNIPFTQPVSNSGMLEVKVYSNTPPFNV